MIPLAFAAQNDLELGSDLTIHAFEEIGSLRAAGLLADEGGSTSATSGRSHCQCLRGPTVCRSYDGIPPLALGNALMVNLLRVQGCMRIILKFRQEGPERASAARIGAHALAFLSEAE